MPISLVRSSTETSMMFITPMPPTSSEIAATAPRSNVSWPVVCVSVAAICSMDWIRKSGELAGTWWRVRSRLVISSITWSVYLRIGDRKTNRRNDVAALRRTRLGNHHLHCGQRDIDNIVRGTEASSLAYQNPDNAHNNIAHPQLLPYRLYIGEKGGSDIGANYSVLDGLVVIIIREEITVSNLILLI